MIAVALVHVISSCYHDLKVYELIQQSYTVQQEGQT